MIKHSITRHNSKLHIHAYNVKFPFLHNLSNVNKKYPCSSGLSKAYAVEKSQIKGKTCFGIWHKIPKLFFKNAFDLSSDYNNLLKRFPCGKQHMLLLRNKKLFKTKKFSVRWRNYYLWIWRRKRRCKEECESLRTCNQTNNEIS